MSLRTRNEMEENMRYLIKGIQGLESRRYRGEVKRLKMKRFRKYLERTERYELSEDFKGSEKTLNEWFSTLKESMKEKEYEKSLLFVSKVFDRLEVIYRELYGSQFSGKRNKAGVR
jgi:hypothetical protein